MSMLRNARPKRATDTPRAIFHQNSTNRLRRVAVVFGAVTVSESHSRHLFSFAR
jgi:hypothetical protein